MPNLILKRGGRDQPISFSPNKGSQDVFQKILKGATMGASSDELKPPENGKDVYRKMKT